MKNLQFKENHPCPLCTEVLEAKTLLELKWESAQVLEKIKKTLYSSEKESCPALHLIHNFNTLFFSILWDKEVAEEFWDKIEEMSKLYYTKVLQALSLLEKKTPKDSIEKIRFLQLAWETVESELRAEEWLNNLIRFLISDWEERQGYSEGYSAGNWAFYRLTRQKEVEMIFEAA